MGLRSTAPRSFAIQYRPPSPNGSPIFALKLPGIVSQTRQSDCKRVPLRPESVLPRGAQSPAFHRATKERRHPIHPEFPKYENTLN